MDQNVENRGGNVPVRPSKEKEWNGPVWKHPFMLYVLCTLVLFIFLLLMGYLAVENEWIPSRGIGHG